MNPSAPPQTRVAYSVINPIRLLVYSLVLLVLATSSLAGDNPVARLEHFFQTTDSLSGRFSQTVVDADGEVLQQSRGSVKLLRPGRFAWRYETPYEQTIIADGDNLWIYDKDLAQVTVRSLSQALGTAPIMLLSQASPLHEAFEVISSERRGGLDWVTLKPEAADTDFTRVQMALGQAGLKQMVLDDQFGQQTLIRFSILQTDVELKPADFEFKVPAGVDLIGPDQPS